MFNSFYVRLDLLNDPGFPLRLLSRATAFINPLSQSLDVSLGVQQERMVWVILWRVLKQVLEQTTKTRRELIVINRQKSGAGVAMIHLNQKLIARNPLHRFDHQIAQSLFLLVFAHVLLLE